MARDDLAALVESIAVDTEFSGVVRVDIGDEVELERAYGWADRAHELPNGIDTQFGIASGNKGLTALVVMGLIGEGRFDLATPARTFLGDDLPLIDDAVTIEQLLAHRSGIGDYLDETSYEVTDYVMPVPVQDLATTEQFLTVLDGHPSTSKPDERFSYNNGGFVVLALIAERVSGIPFHDLVEQRVCERAGMHDTRFLRSDELPARAAIGYLTTDSPRTNVFHLPVRGNGDGGIYTTVADIHAFWPGLFAGRIVSTELVDEMIRPRSHVPDESMRYGLGFWLHETGPAVILIGSDAGVSFRTVHDPTRQSTHTVISNTSRGAWPITRAIEDLLA